MNILELVKQLETLKQDYKRQIDDLPKSYVRGSEVFKEASVRVKNGYEASKIAIRSQIEAQLEVIEAKADYEMEVNKNIDKPTLEDVAEGYKVIDVITKTANMLSPATLEALLVKVKDLDQLAVINDVINSTNELDLKKVMKNHLITVDSYDAERRNTKQLVEDFRQALAVSGDSMTFTVMNLASQLAEV